MFIITGSSPRQEVVTVTTTQCPRCGVFGPHSVLRTWTVRHVYWVPYTCCGMTPYLACATCRAVYPFQPPPGMVRELPFLGRFGCLLLPLVPALLFAAVFVVALCSPAPPPRSVRPQTGAREELERHLASGAVFAEGEKATEIGAQVKQCFQLGADPSLEPEKAAIAVRSLPGPPRRFVIVIQFDGLRRCSDTWRLDLLAKLQNLLKGSLRPEDEVIVGLRGAMCYGAIAQGRMDADWTIQVGDMVDSSDLGRALLAPPAASSGTGTK